MSRTFHPRVAVEVSIADKERVPDACILWPAVILDEPTTAFVRSLAHAGRVAEFPGKPTILYVVDGERAFRVTVEELP